MNVFQRWYLVVSLTALASGLSLSCLEYRVYEADIPASRLLPVISFGKSYPLLHSPNTLPTMEQALIEATGVTSGLYARNGLTNSEAATGGLLIPALLLIAAGFFAIGSGRNASHRTKPALDAVAMPLGPSIVHPTPQESVQPSAATKGKPRTDSRFSTLMMVVVAFSPTLMILDLPSAMLMTRNRYPPWMFALHCLWAISAHANG